MRLFVIGRAVDTESARDWPEHVVLPRDGWTLERNHDFVKRIVNERAPVYLASAITRDNLVDKMGQMTVFARELAMLSRARFERVGNFLLPLDPWVESLRADPIGVYQRVRTRGDGRLVELLPLVNQLGAIMPSLAEEASEIVRAGVPYGRALRLARDFVSALSNDVASVFVPKVAGELEPLIDLFPEVIAFPTLARLDVDFFLATRAVPVFPLGLVPQPLFSDGMSMSPREYFFHDIDHARFMLREELLSRGVEMPDAYQSLDGSPPTTLVDGARNLHRVILAGSRPLIDAAQLGDAALLEARAQLGERLLAAAALEPEDRAQAVALVLFEITHEKGFPLDGAVLSRETVGPRHVDKLCDKLTQGFFGERLQAPPEVVALLDWARQWIGARA